MLKIKLILANHPFFHNEEWKEGKELSPLMKVRQKLKHKFCAQCKMIHFVDRDRVLIFKKNKYSE
jgi:hypothetical protein